MFAFSVVADALDGVALGVAPVAWRAFTGNVVVDFLGDEVGILYWPRKDVEEAAGRGTRDMMVVVDKLLAFTTPLVVTEAIREAAVAITYNIA